ncbi:MAG: SGNH/GDSL hydrolase family protein [Planctomycetota bacterium]|jgi:lysophospholipase L1-like esterase
MTRSAKRRGGAARWIRRGALVLVLVALGAEGGLRVYAGLRGLDVEQAFGRPHPEGGLFVPHPYTAFGLRPVPGSPDNNAYGMRGPERSPPKPPGVVRILCLGGSTTYGSGLDADEAYPARLAAALARDAPEGTRYEVLNCGVPGYTSIESLVALELRLLDFDPDGIVVYHGINDARMIQTRGFRPDYTHMRRTWRDPDISTMEWWLLRHSRAYAWLAHTLGFGLKSVRLEELVFVEEAPTLYRSPDEDGVNQRGVAAFLRNIRHMVALARAQGVDVVLTTFAMRELPGKPRPEQDYAPTVAAMNRQLAGYAEREHLPLVDMAAGLNRRADLFYDAIHFNARGTEAQADLVLQTARAAGLWGLR